MLDGSGVKAMPGSIPTPSSGSLYKNKNKNTGSKMGHTHKKKLRIDENHYSRFIWFFGTSQH
jgi:hypothetical protein